MMRPFSLFVLLLAALLPVLGGCVRPGGAPHITATDRPFTVAAASNLQFAFTEMGRRFTQESGQEVVFTFGSSGNLARQVENGAPVDLYAAANAAFVDELIAKGILIPETRLLYARGRLALTSSKVAGLQVTNLSALSDPSLQRIAIANPDHAPYGVAAKEALMAAGLWEALKSKIIYAENVRQALQFVQTGNAEAGLVALSEAHVPEVTYVLVDEALHSPLVQALAVVKGSPHRETAEAFAAFLTGAEGQRVMEQFGFASPEGG